MAPTAPCKTLPCETLSHGPAETGSRSWRRPSRTPRRLTRLRRRACRQRHKQPRLRLVSTDRDPTDGERGQQLMRRNSIPDRHCYDVGKTPDLTENDSPGPSELTHYSQNSRSDHGMHGWWATGRHGDGQPRRWRRRCDADQHCVLNDTHVWNCLGRVRALFFSLSLLPRLLSHPYDGAPS